MPVARRGVRRLCAGVLFALTVSWVAGCDLADSLLEVKLPGNVQASDLDDPALGQTLVLSAQGSFECALGSNLYWAGVWSGEVMMTAASLQESAAGTRSDAWSTLSMPCTSGNGPNYQPFHTSRALGELATSKIEGWLSEGIDIPNAESLLARAELYVAYSTVFLAEQYCSVTFDGGPRMTREEGFRRAESDFTKAIEHATASTADDANELLNVALIGRARARLNLGDNAGVVADASQVPADFVYFATFDPAPSYRNLHLYEKWEEDRRGSVPPSDRNLDVQGVPDPRMAMEDLHMLADDNIADYWRQLKWNSLGADVHMATGREAMLMIAEAEGGQMAVDIINDLRATVSELPWVADDHPGLPQFSSSGPAEIEAQVHEERRRELWLQGQRLGDMLRWGTPFPQGTDHYGRPYGDNTCMPLPELETRANENL